MMNMLIKDKKFRAGFGEAFNVRFGCAGQLNLMIHHKTPASCASQLSDRRAWRTKKAKVSTIILNEIPKHPFPRDNWSKKTSCTARRDCLLYKRRTHGRNAAAAFGERRKKNLKKAKRMREWMLRRVNKKKTLVRFPKLAIIWNWNIIL